MDFTLYWFMFPVAFMVSTIAMMSGIAGTALFMPIFILIFPLLGHIYIIDTPGQMVAAALLTSSFGFASGFYGYHKRGLIDFEIARRFLKYSLIAAVIGTLLSQDLSATGLRLFYGLLMVVLAMVIYKQSLLRRFAPAKIPWNKTFKDRSGQIYTYDNYSPNVFITALGGLFTGLLSVGIGETTITQLVKYGRLPVPVAAATSVFVVICTLAAASIFQVLQLTVQEGVATVPWHLVCYTVPGVIIGGQLGPVLQGRVQQSTMQKGFIILFVFIGLIMFVTVINDIRP